tara:strand:- start:60 stop:326 length:267 start_codon:yes stop_codon:yes gene_type:complete
MVMRERFSDVVSWFGFGFAVFTYLVWGLYVFGPDIGVDMTEHDNRMFIGVTYREIYDGESFARIVYASCVVVNYIVVGRTRLLPWSKE